MRPSTSLKVGELLHTPTTVRTLAETLKVSKPTAYAYIKSLKKHPPAGFKLVAESVREHTTGPIARRYVLQVCG